MSLSFITSTTSGRFAIVEDTRVVFETYHLQPEEQQKLREMVQHIDRRAWSGGHDTVVHLVREFASALHITSGGTPP